MLRAQGYAHVFGGFKDVETDTITCGHCNQIVLVKPGTAATVYLLPQMAGPHKEEGGAMCKQCMKHICLRCYDLMVCTPLMRQIEESESKRQMMQAIGL